MLAPHLKAIHIFVLFFSVETIHCWDNEELELFDLVEEVNTNFYDVIGVEQTATSAEIRRAYRKLSVKLHPDKNKEEGAEEKFRQLVAVYEVLKDEQQRQRYNDVLINGLPDWRTPVYYYRKARKLGLVELACLLLVIVTIGHFIVSWSVYLERKFELEEVFQSKKKKDKKSKKAKLADERVDEALREHLETLHRPQLIDMVPCQIVMGLISFSCSLPSRLQQLGEQLREWREQRRLLQLELEAQEAGDDEDGEEETGEMKRPKRRQRVEIPEFQPEMVTGGAPVIYLPEARDNLEPKREDRTGQEWTDDEESLLAKAVAKFPSGTLNRWEKISDMVGRSVAEVTAKSKTIKTKVIKHVDPASQGVTGSVNEKVTFKKGQTLTSDISHGQQWTKNSSVPVAKSWSSKETIIKLKLPTESGPANSEQGAVSCAGEPPGSTANPETDPSLWTQTQQKTLEWALAQYPRGTAERWEKIAEHITGKTKEDCIARFKHLADVIKRKKEEAAAATKR